MISTVVKSNWNGNFADFRDLKKKNKLGRSGLILLQLLVLYFANINGWQLSSSE